jgi:hypothetical protein
LTFFLLFFFCQKIWRLLLARLRYPLQKKLLQINSCFYKLVQNSLQCIREQNSFTFSKTRRQNTFCVPPTHWERVENNRKRILAFCFSPSFDLYLLIQCKQMRRVYHPPLARPLWERDLNLLVYSEKGDLLRQFVPFIQASHVVNPLNCLELLRSDLLVTATPRLVLFSAFSPSTVSYLPYKATCLRMTKQRQLVGLYGRKITFYQMQSEGYLLEEISSVFLEPNHQLDLFPNIFEVLRDNQLVFLHRSNHPLHVSGNSCLLFDSSGKVLSSVNFRHYWNKVSSIVKDPSTENLFLCTRSAPRKGVDLLSGENRITLPMKSKHHLIRFREDGKLFIACPRQIYTLEPAELKQL